jgi:hypothetical protein
MKGEGGGGGTAGVGAHSQGQGTWGTCGGCSLFAPAAGQWVWGRECAKEAARRANPTGAARGGCPAGRGRGGRVRGYGAADSPSGGGGGGSPAGKSAAQSRPESLGRRWRALGTRGSAAGGAGGPNSGWQGCRHTCRRLGYLSCRAQVAGPRATDHYHAPPFGAAAAAALLRPAGTAGCCR